MSCFIDEPIAGTVPPREGFLEGLCSVCTDEGIVLIFYRELEEKSARLSSGIAEAAKKAAFPIYSTRVGSMFCAFFTGGEVRDWTTASACDTGAFARFFD